MRSHKIPQQQQPKAPVLRSPANASLIIAITFYLVQKASARPNRLTTEKAWERHLTTNDHSLSFKWNEWNILKWDAKTLRKKTGESRSGDQFNKSNELMISNKSNLTNVSWESQSEKVLSIPCLSWKAT